MDLWHFTPVTIIYFLTAGISILLAILAWQMRPVKGAGHFAFMMISVGIWVLASLLGNFSYSYSWKIFMMKCEYVGMAGAVYLWVVFIAKYTHNDKWLKKWVYVLLALIPAITLFNVFQAPDNTLIHESYYLVTIHGISVFAQNYGTVFYLWASYAYLLMILGVVLLLIQIIQTPKGMRKQLILLIPAVFVVMVPNVLFITKNNPIEPFDPTPLALVIVGILFLSTFYFFQFLNIVPVAHDMVFKNVKAGVIILSRENLILEINPIACQFLGAKDSNLFGQSIFDIMPECKEVLTKITDDSEIKTDISLGNGQNIYELKIASLVDNSNVIHGKILMLYDMTEQKMAINELDAYARTVAHDLKTPLGQMMGYAQLLRDNDVDAELLKKEYLNNIISGGEKIKTIIDGLLMLAKIRNQQSIELKEIEMKSIIKSVLIRLYDSIKKSKATIHLPEHWEKSLGNAIWVEEVWINLVSNAVKYGGNPPVIELGSEKKDDYVLYWVRDNGNGLSKEDKVRIFEEFSRIHPSKDSIKGHGLGLSIVQRIIKKIGGEVEVESIVGKGSTFSFTLPAHKSD